VATFSNLVVGTGGSYTFTATPSSISGVTGAVDSGAFIVSQAPAITSPNTTTFTTGSAGTFTVSAVGFPPPTFSKTGALPSGVTLSSAGVLSGTPAAGTGGTYPITITAANGVGSSATQSFTLTVTQAPVITSPNTMTFTTGSPGTFTVSATGFPAPTFSKTGALPSGVTLSSAGVLSGTPATGSAGTYPLMITAANGVGSGATQSFTLTVVAGALTITSPTSSNQVTVAGGATQNVTVTGTNFVSGATVAISGGFTVNSVTFVSSTQLTVNLTAKNGNGNRGTYNLTVTNPGGVSVTSSSSIINA
jgi:hypothetical protein